MGEDPEMCIAHESVMSLQFEAALVLFGVASGSHRTCRSGWQLCDASEV